MRRVCHCLTAGSPDLFDYSLCSARGGTDAGDGSTQIVDHDLGATPRQPQVHARGPVPRRLP